MVVVPQHAHRHPSQSRELSDTQHGAAHETPLTRCESRYLRGFARGIRTDVVIRHPGSPERRGASPSPAPLPHPSPHPVERSNRAIERSNRSHREINVLSLGSRTGLSTTLNRPLDGPEPAFRRAPAPAPCPGAVSRPVRQCRSAPRPCNRLTCASSWRIRACAPVRRRSPRPRRDACARRLGEGDGATVVPPPAAGGDQAGLLESSR